MPMDNSFSLPARDRIDWVDTAKGICIIFVVMVHSVLGVEKVMGAEGWMHNVVAFARPFRMPDFFLISGLFLGLVIDRPWRRYVDRKIVHFVYFYLLWLTIQFAFKAPGLVAEHGLVHTVQSYLVALVQPFGTLWFIYLLPLFFLFTRLSKTLPVWFVLLWAALLEVLPVHTGWLVFDEFCARFVYFYAGYAFAGKIFDIADWLRNRPLVALGFLAVWAPVNAALVFTPAAEMLAPYIQGTSGNTGNTGGYSELPLLSLVLGLAGAMAIICVASLISRIRLFDWLTWLGAHSIVVYLAFFLPMAVTRVVLVKTGLIPDIGTVSALVLFAGVAGPVVLYHLIQWTGYGRFLFERPEWAKTDADRQPAGNPAAAK